MLNGVGATIMNPNAIGILQGKNELNLQTHGINSPVSGCMEVDTTVYAVLSVLISFLVKGILLSPVSFNCSSSLSF